MRSVPGICSTGTCFKTTATFDWLANCENRKSKDGINCKISLISEVSAKEPRREYCPERQIDKIK